MFRHARTLVEGTYFGVNEEKLKTFTFFENIENNYLLLAVINYGVKAL